GLEVLGSPPKVALQADPYQVVSGPQLAMDLERAVDVRGTLHVDHHQRAVLLGNPEDPLEVLEAKSRGQVESELRELHGDQAVEVPLLPDALERPDVRLGRLGRLVRRRDVL